jgi:serine/threonine-protein kinase
MPTEWPLSLTDEKPQIPHNRHIRERKTCPGLNRVKYSSVESSETRTGPGGKMSAHMNDLAAPPRLPSDAELVIPHGADPESDIIGPIAGRYDRGERIARGGMGIIYKAHDRQLNRTVAVKVMRSKYMDRQDLLRRFLSEARISGRLQHPGIVPVYDVGVLADTRPFIAMKLIEGQTLAKLLRERSSPSDNQAHFLKIFESLCQAMAYAHKEGVIHRDLKPDNIMVGAFGEVQVMDWGLAKFLNPADAVAATPDGFEAVERSVYLSDERTTPLNDHATLATAVVPVAPEDHGHTTAGEIFGTLAYMPPEQARGEADRMDSRGDVFALGAILCQILTAQPPYFGPLEARKEQAREGRLFGAYVLLDRCGADQTLVLLAKHCLTVDPDARPADAGVLAELMTQCLEGLQDRTRQIEVKRIAAETRLAEAEGREQLARRARQLSRMLAVAGVVVAALLASGLGWYANDRIARNIEEANRRTAAIEQIDEALEQAESLDGQARQAADFSSKERAARGASLAVERASALLSSVSQPPEEYQARLDRVKQQLNEVEVELVFAQTMSQTSRPELARANLKLGLALAEAGKNDEALAALRRAVKDDPKAAAAHARIGDILLNQKEYASAAESFAVAVAVDPQLAGAQVGLGRAELALGHDDAAMNALQAAAKLGATGAVHAGLGELHLKKWEAAGAAAEFRKAIELEPANADYRLKLITALETANDGAGALKEAEAAAKAIPASASIQLKTAALLGKAGNTATTIEAYRKALAADPKNYAARHALGKLLTETGDESALDELKQVSEANPTDAGTQADLGEAMLRFGRFRAAASTLREAAEKLAEGDPRREGCRDSARKATKYAALEPRVSDVIAGTVVPQSASGWADFGEVCRRTNRNAAAAKFFQSASEGDERYAPAAAIYAALAGFGLGSDAGDTTEETRAELRKQALTAFGRSPKWAASPELHPLKGGTLEKLEAAEREKWRTLLAAK